MTFTASLADIVKVNENGLLGSHPSWSRVRLRDLADILNGFAFPSRNFSKDKGKPLLRIRDILANRTETYYNGDFDATYLVDQNDLVIGMDGDFNCTLWKGPQALLNQRVCKVTADDRFYSPKLLSFILPGYLRAINSQTSSVTVKHLSSNTVADIPLPLPPVPEQHRIVAKIEELFTKLDAAVEALKKIKVQLKRYRQAVLKSAFEGKLTEQWREKHQEEFEPASVLLERIKEERKKIAKDKYKELPPLDTSDLPELPDGWVWMRIGELFDVSYGLSEKLTKTESSNELDVPIIRIANVTEFGELDLSSLKFFPLDKEKKDRMRLFKGDVLFNWRNAPKWIGKSAVFEKETDFVNASFLLKLRPYLPGYSQFIATCLNYLRMTGYFLTRVDNAVNQANFNASKTKQIEIPFPCLDEQSQIFKEIDYRFSLADAIENVIVQTSIKVDRLHQSILKKAFEGKLVPQDPSDEPAEKLLERIKAEKAKQESDREKPRRFKHKRKVK